MSLTHTGARVDNILVDARALQDPNYRFRGVGQHGAALLSALRHHAWDRRPRLTAMVDHGAEPLQAGHADLFDAVTTVVRAPREDRAWLLSLSPMTHDPLWLSALLLDPTVFKVALFYDLIPLEMPYRYLRDARSRADYLVSFAWLGRYDAFAAISDHSRRALVRARGIDERKTFVTGVAVRPALEPQPDEAPLPRLERSHILVSGGGDPRKNPECALLAHARSSAPKVAPLPIQVFGGYSATARSDLRSVYAKAGGKASNLIFLPHLTDSQMREAYRTAVLTVVPSQAEGFSIPIVESAAAGTPVLVSDVDAHPELVTDGRLRFDPGDPDSLRSAMERILADDDIWGTARDAVAQLWPRYTEEAVGERFVKALLDRIVAAPAVLRRARPRIAVLTPLPPAATGIADFSIRTLKALSRHASLDLFTDTPEAVAEPHFHSLGSVRQARLSARAFDATVAVLGNSDHHRGIFEFLLERGGAAIAHDARMLGFYRFVLGEERALAVGRRETRDVTLDGDRIMRWLDDERDLPALFLSEVVSSASPLFVYSKRMAREIRHRYGVMPEVLPYAQLRSFDPSSAQSRAARARLGIADGERVICSFGIVAPNKAPDVLLWAVKLLARWGVISRLVMVGSVSQGYKTVLRRHIDELDLASQVDVFEENLSEQVYSDFLSVADAAVQLRAYGFGQLSGALNDCIAAALPTVANEDLAGALDAPAFVRRVPDDLSPVLIAEALLDILGRERGTPELIEEARRYAGLHSPEEHARNLIAGLGFSPVENA